jgi:GH43 family beta-xylosidase
MRQLPLLLIMACVNVFCISGYGHQKDSVKSTFTNPVFDGADPWILKKDGYYYYSYSSGKSIYISKSEFLTKKGDTRKVWTAPAKGWNRTNIWAPELHYLNGNWYIYYAAGEAGPPYIHQRAGVLQSAGSDPFGEWTDMGMLYTGDNPDLKSDNRWAIDMTVFEFRKQLYAIWSGWVDKAETDNTPQHLYIAEMESPVKIKSVRHRISSPDQKWETGGPLDLEEGPEILKHKGDLFIVYSCRESWTVDYRLGILRLKSRHSPILSPASWEKSGPVLSGPYGTGHCSFTVSPDGKENWIIYHSKKDSVPGWSRNVRMQPFIWKNGFPEFGPPVKPGEEIPRPSGEVKNASE